MAKSAEKPVCTIVTPTHNCLDFLPKMLETVYAQNVDEIEMIIVNDNSSDGTEAYLAECARKDTRLTVLNTEGIGPGRARNLAISEATTDLIAFLDADDLWRPGNLRKQLDFHASNPDVVLSFTDYEQFNPEIGKMGRCFDLNGNWFLNEGQTGFELLPDAESVILRNNIVATSCVIAKREALQNAKGFATDLRSATDWDMWLKIAGMGPVGFTPEVGMDYFLMRPGSMTKNRNARLEAIAQIISRYADRTEPEIAAAYKQAVINLDIAKGDYAVEEGEEWTALSYYLQAMKHGVDKRVMRSAAGSLVAGMTFGASRKRAA